MKTTFMFIDRRMDKKDGVQYIYIHTLLYMCTHICKTTECYLSMRKNEILSCEKNRWTLSALYQAKEVRERQILFLLLK